MTLAVINLNDILNLVEQLDKSGLNKVKSKVESLLEDKNK